MKRLIALAALLLSLCGVTSAPAGAQQVNYSDWGWIESYYGSVNITVHDYCPYTTNKNDCRHLTTTHWIASTGQVIRDVQFMPEWIWIYAINAGQQGVRPIVTQWKSWNGPYQSANVFWTPTDAECGGLPENTTCGAGSNGTMWDNGSFIGRAGNTLHNRYVQVTYNVNPGGGPGSEFMAQNLY